MLPTRPERLKAGALVPIAGVDMTKLRAAVKKNAAAKDVEVLPAALHNGLRSACSNIDDSAVVFWHLVRCGHLDDGLNYTVLELPEVDERLDELLWAAWRRGPDVVRARQSVLSRELQTATVFVRLRAGDTVSADERYRRRWPARQRRRRRRAHAARVAERGAADDDARAD